VKTEDTKVNLAMREVTETEMNHVSLRMTKVRVAQGEIGMAKLGKHAEVIITVKEEGTGIKITKSWLLINDNLMIQ